jgi:hypothetical protein
MALVIHLARVFSLMPNAANMLSVDDSVVPTAEDLAELACKVHLDVLRLSLIRVKRLGEQISA